MTSIANWKIILREKMDDLEFKQKKLDTKSESFCAAKWYNATIWLGSGMTTSCHHPLPHKIDLEEIKIILVLYTTHVKKRNSVGRCSAVTDQKVVSIVGRLRT